eukprot:g24323.t1
MQTLYMATTGGFDWKEALDLVAKIGEGGILAFLFYIAFFNFAVFNVLTGMFVDHAMKWSQSDNQTLGTNGETRGRPPWAITIRPWALLQVCHEE